MRTFNYVIMRHGSNSANQSMCDSMAIDIIVAHDRREALEIALRKTASGRYTLYTNQCLEAAPLSSLNKDDVTELQERLLNEEALVNCVCNVCGKGMGKTPMWNAINTYCGCND